MTRLQGYIIMYLTILLAIKCIRESKASENERSAQEESVEDFKRLCPYTDMCFDKAQKNVSRRNSFLEYPCCGWCTCEENCGNNCCPDKPERFLDKLEVKELKNAQEQCIYAQLRPYSITALNGKSYKMVSNCPASYIDHDVTSKCLREYHDFDFEKGDFKTLMPVSSNLLNVTFKNIFCAICNAASRYDLIFWDTKVECENKKKFSLLHVSEIMLKLSEEPFCQVMFVPSPSTPWNAVSICEDEIDRCNVTSTWKTYDPNIESACHSYSSIYDNFKNIHCFLCNGHSINDINDICLMGQVSGDGSSFVALLNFDYLERSTESGSIGMTTCSSGSRYDPYKVT
jgi:hypothetical protein